jgi:hypothetical protein
MYIYILIFINLMNNYQKKLSEFVFEDIKFSKNLNILEFGVRYGESTKKFIEIVENNGGHLYSIDVDNCEHISNSKSWTFIQSRDDNFSYLESKLPKKFDLIYLDSFHDAKHVQKIFYYYYKKLNLNGLFIIDDISHIPYLKKSVRDNFNCEINNQETFDKLIEIFSFNQDNFTIFFSFRDSGLAKIKKQTDFELNEQKKIYLRKFTLKNLIRKIYFNFK